MTEIAEVLCEHAPRLLHPRGYVCACERVLANEADWANHAAEVLNVPPRSFVDDQGRRWEWCGGVPETWAWRVTGMHIEA